MGLTSSLSERLRDAAGVWARSQYELVTLAAQFAESGQWALDGCRSAAEWLAMAADCEASTAREWIRVGRCLQVLHASAEAFANGEISYSKVRTLSRVATVDNEAELLELAKSVPASQLSREIARWLDKNTEPEALERYHQSRRSVCRRNEPDGMVSYSVRLPPLDAATLDAALTTRVMRGRPCRDANGAWPTLAQQQADALVELVTNGGGKVDTEVVLHVRGDGCTADDGTPVPATVIERIAPQSAIRLMIHDAEAKPINASGRHRQPNDRQKRIVMERDRCCADCGREELLTYDHNPDFAVSQRTVVDELELRCAPCHWSRHRAA